MGNTTLRKISRIPLFKYLNFIVLFSITLLFLFGATKVYAEINSITPSTNVNNISKGWAFVQQASKGVRTTDIKFTSTRSFNSCFEYRLDGKTDQILSENGGLNYNTTIQDGLYPYKCVNNSSTEVTLTADEYVEIRMVFGAERDERFDWTRFDVIPEISTPVINGFMSPNINCGSLSNIHSATVDWTDSTGGVGGIVGYEYSIDYPLINGGTGHWTTFLSKSQYTGTLNEGLHTVKVRARDLLGNVSNWSNECSITTDWEAPIAPQISFPTPEQYFKATPILNDWNDISDISGIKEYRIKYIYDDGHTFAGAPYRITSLSERNHQPGNWEQGGVTIWVQAIDNAGNEGTWSEPVHYYYDSTPPIMPSGLYFWDIKNNKAIQCGGFSNTHNIKEYWNADTKEINFSHYEYSSFDAPIGNPGLIKNLFYTNYFDSSWWNIPIEGKYGFQIRTVDKAGNTSPWALNNVVGIENSCTINIDWTAPIVEITNPSDNSFVRGVVDFKGTVQDSNLLRYYYYISNVTSKVITTPTNLLDETIFQWDTTSTIDGTYEMRLEARDLADNKTSDSIDIIHVTVDNEIPKGEILGIRYPKADSSVFITNQKSPLIYGTYSDNFDVDNVEVKIGDILGTVTLENENWIAQFNSIIDGTYTISLKIVDKAGNEFSTTKEIQIDTVAPKATYSHYINGVLFDGVIAEVDNLSDLSFTASYEDPDPSSGLKYDSYVIFQAQDDGTFRFSANGKLSYCSWRGTPNIVNLTGTSYELTELAPFTNCISTLPDGEYYLAHQLFDNAVRNDIPSISQFRDITALHFIIDNLPKVTIETPNTEVEAGITPLIVKAIVQGGNLPLTYEWTSSNGSSSLGDTFTFIPILVGDYTLTVKVTDSDGDFDEKSVLIKVNPIPTIEQPEQSLPEVLGATNMLTNNPKVLKKPITVVNEPTDEIQEELVTMALQETEDISEVKGTQTCDNPKTVSGYVYIDKNGNKKKDNNEKIFSNIKIRIYTIVDSKEDTVSNLITDEKGYWKIELCYGKYFIQLDSNTLPNNYKLQNEGVLGIVLTDEKNKESNDFILIDSRTFLQKNWLWIILAIGYFVTFLLITSNSKKKNK